MKQNAFCSLTPLCIESHIFYTNELWTLISMIGRETVYDGLSTIFKRHSYSSFIKINLATTLQPQ